MADVDPTNFRQLAHEAVAFYAKNGNFNDALFWGRVVSLFEAQLLELKRSSGGPTRPSNA